MRSNWTYLIFFCCFITTQITIAQKKNVAKKASVSSKKPIVKKDSLTTRLSDTLKNKSIDTIPKKESIQDIIVHTAKDYTKQNAKKKTVELYNEAHIVYGDIDLKAGYVLIDYLKKTLFAKGITDSTGYVQRPVFKQGLQESEQDSMVYNFDTKRALIYGIKTKQDPGVIVLGNKAKRVNDSVIYMRNIKFTTSDKKNPDYYIGVDRAKVVPKKKIVAGVSNLVIADVPTPLFLPFAYFPMGDSREAGFILPSWGQNTNQGFFLQNGGYYLPIGDYADLELTGDLYSNGSYGLRAASSYVVRYKFNGSFNVRFENIKQGQVGFDDFSETNNFNIQWSHRQDPKSNPNSNFSASVNLGSSQFFRQSLNEFNNSQFLNNTFNSSISYYKNFVGTPFNLNLTATHTQNSNQSVENNISMTLPSLQLNMSRIFPFAGKGGVKKNALQKTGLTYSAQGEYRITTNDDDFFTGRMFENAVSGVRHRVDANTNIKVMRYFTLSPSINYTEGWNFNSIRRRFDANSGEVVTDTINGLRSFREYSTSLNLTTNIYGDFTFNKGRLKALRHTLRPTVSFIYSPDLTNTYLEQVMQSNDPTDILEYSPFENSLFRPTGGGLVSAIGIGINNVLEGKVAPKDPDSDEEDRKITILNNLNFNTSYNIAADSLKWTPINMSAGTRLFKDKLALNFAGVFDPYEVNENGLRIDEFASFPRLTSARLTANYSISASDFDKSSKNNSSNKNANGLQDTPDVLGAGIQPTNAFASNLPNGNNDGNKDVKTELYKSKVPWRLNLAYSALYSDTGFRPGKIQTHSVTFGGDIELSPKWKIGFNSGYDLIEGTVTFTRLNFSRDLDSWRLNFNWVPFGPNQSYNFFIGVKSSILSDLKYDQNRPPNRVLF